ncbi:MAG: serine/threonine-protein kinase [Phycisphaerales bacterium]|nr:serine/threonine-protein kinase [Phycisphaerales bacterium]
MNAVPAGEIERVFDAVMLVSPADRPAELDRLCGADVRLRREVESLLDALDAPSDFLCPDAVGGSDIVRALSSGEVLVPGSTPPGFKIISLIGSGGMGRVYRAEQQRPRRIVALKVIRPELTTPAMRRRFEREADILARLEHPGIARIYEAASTTSNEHCPPYIAMELIDGQPITTSAHSRSLDPRACVELMLSVCEAVAYAHRRGVIHRDLKPANILVTSDGQARIVDFGVARVVESDLAGTVHTLAGELVGTLQYMSPEQLSGDPSQIDVRSDVYALGLILFEVLAGRPPIDLRGLAVLDALSRLRDAAPMRLSEALASPQGDLDVIVAKSLDRDPGRRYQSVDDLADDLRRWLEGRPIRARDDSALYVLTRQVRRYRRVLAMSACVVLLVGALSVFALMQWARNHTLLKQNIVALDKAEDSAARAEAVSEFVRSIFVALDPSFVRGRDTTVLREMLEKAERDVAQLSDKPGAEVLALSTIGQAWLRLGEYDRAEARLAEAIALGRRTVGPEDPDTLDAINALGILFTHMQRREEAEALYREVFERRRDTLGPDAQATLQAANNRASNLVGLGQVEEAVEILVDTLARQERVLGPDHAETMQSMGNLGAACVELGRIDEARSIYQRLLERRRSVLGADHPDTLTSLANLAFLDLEHGDPASALAPLSEAAETRRRVLGPDRFETIVAEYNYATALLDTGDAATAERIFDSLRERSARNFGAHDLTCGAALRRIAALRRLARPSEALTCIDATLPLFTDQAPEGDWRVGLLLSARAGAMADLGRDAEAESLYHQALAMLGMHSGSDDARTKQTARALVEFYESRGRYEDASRLREVTPVD